MSIELRLSDVDPPDPDPPRTIYRDLPALPDPVVLGLTIRYFNHDDINLYFRITGQRAGYTFQTVDLGLLGSGASAYRNLDNFASRAKPAAPFEDWIILILRAYIDAGYTNLAHEFRRTVHVIFIDSTDGSWTLDESDDFDDGTVQGWAVQTETARNVALDMRNDFVLSAPWSIRLRQWGTVAATYEERARLFKAFVTADRNQVFAIIHVRPGRQADAGAAWIRNKYLEVQHDTTVLTHIGRIYDTVKEAYFPENKWIRIVVPLPRNTALEVRIVHSVCAHVTATNLFAYLWFDDFKIISKD